MQATIFAKKVQKKDGTTFKRYITKLMKKDGTEETMNVKFREECGVPANCPCNIEFDKSNANFSQKVQTYTDNETGEEKETVSKTLWINAWQYGEEYVDTSMDEFAE